MSGLSIAGVPARRVAQKVSEVRVPILGESFSSSQVVSLVPSITFRMLDYWSKQGILIPSIKPGVGSGNHRRYSLFFDLVALRSVDLMRAAGVNLNEVRRVATFIQTLSSDEPLEDARILMTPETVRLTRTGAGKIDLRTHLAGETLFSMLDLSAIVSNVLDRVDGFDRNDEVAKQA